MAGTDEDAVAAADDALYVLTAVLLTPAKFPSVLGDDYPEACAALGLPPLADGYGLVLGQDGDGARWTVVIDDVSLVAVAVASWDCGMEYDLSPDERTVVTALPGWPLAVAVAAPGVPVPHDPGPEVTDQSVATDGRSGAKVSRHGGVRRVLAEARAYVDTPPPLGRVRSSFAPGDARTLRADGPGWSLVARTDDIAFILLDEEPGEVLPVGRGPSLPGLLEALDKMAVRPS